MSDKNDLCDLSCIFTDDDEIDKPDSTTDPYFRGNTHRFVPEAVPEGKVVASKLTSNNSTTSFPDSFQVLPNYNMIDRSMVSADTLHSHNQLSRSKSTSVLPIAHQTNVDEIKRNPPNPELSFSKNDDYCRIDAMERTTQDTMFSLCSSIMCEKQITLLAKSDQVTTFSLPNNSLNDIEPTPIEKMAWTLPPVQPSIPFTGHDWNCTIITEQVGMTDQTKLFTQNGQYQNKLNISGDNQIPCQLNLQPINPTITATTKAGAAEITTATTTSIDIARIDSSNNSIDNEVPNVCLKPLSAYNYFFRDERDNIVYGESYIDGQLPPPVNTFTQAKMNKLLTDRWYIDPYKKPRRHRKTHGKIKFTDLGSIIADRWKQLPKHGKDFYRYVAQLDQEQYIQYTNNNNNNTALVSKQSVSSTMDNITTSSSIHCCNSNDDDKNNNISE